MKIKEVFDQLTHGELTQIAIGGVAEGEINETNYIAIMTHVNLGLTQLYKRFHLKEGRLILQPVAGREVYRLHSKHAVNGKPVLEPAKYIIDTVSEPFKDDILKIERVLTDDGVEFGLNNTFDKYSCITQSADTLRIPLALANETDDLPTYLQTARLNLVYRANHPIIDPDVGAFDPGTTEIELPYSHLNALLLFVASRVNNPIGMTNEFNAGNNYAAKFEMECQALEGYGLEVDQGSSGTRLRERGFP